MITLLSTLKNKKHRIYIVPDVRSLRYLQVKNIYLKECIIRENRRIEGRAHDYSRVVGAANIFLHGSATIYKRRNARGDKALGLSLTLGQKTNH